MSSTGPFLTTGAAESVITALLAALGAMGTFLISQLKAKDRQLQKLQETKDAQIKDLTDSMFNRVLPAIEAAAVSVATGAETAKKLTEVTQQVVAELATAVERQRRGGP